MKTFTHLIQEVQEHGLCHHCGGCVAFCTAINYGALELGEDGRPRYRDKDKCIDCGICYSICPEIHELDEEVKKLVSWTAPMGPVKVVAVGRAVDPEVRAKATDGGVVTALLLYLFDRGRIDAAIVSRTVSPFQRQPWLALTREDIINAAGFHFDTLPSLKHFSERYSTYSPSIVELRDVAQKPVRRVAFVGTPCQINAVRRMEVLGVVPSEAIRYHFGLFCAGNFQFGPEERLVLENIGGFRWEEVIKINVKEELMIHLRSNEVHTIPLDRLDFMRRYACQFCEDYAAEFADLSFGGLGAPQGWTTVLARSAQGQEILDRARRLFIEVSSPKDRPLAESRAMARMLEFSARKKAKAAVQLQQLQKEAV
jgi:coenzyme F420 hydrogenase subunit beta